MRTLLTTLSLALALPACVVPKIVGDNNADDDDTGETTDDPGSEETGKDTTTQGEPSTTDAPDLTTGEPSTTDAPDLTTGENTTSTTPVDCEDLTVDACETFPECMPVYGEAEDTPGCLPGANYLGCLPQMPCDTVLLTVCDADGNAFHLKDGCVPAGFDACEGAGTLCAGDDDECADLDEQTCADKGCTQVFGAPHVDQEGTLCADYDAQEFLGCLPPDTNCPPSIPVVCLAGFDEPAWDVPSGCSNIPNFDECEEQVVPACE